MDCLVHEQSIALGMSIDASTHKNYSSALNSYLNFCRIHHLPIDPTPDTLSFFTVYMSYQLKPSSVGTYLSGICNKLEIYFPDVRKNPYRPTCPPYFNGLYATSRDSHISKRTFDKGSPVIGSEPTFWLFCPR